MTPSIRNIVFQKSDSNTVMVLLLILSYIAIAVISLYDYFIVSPAVIPGLLILPYILVYGRASKKSFRLLLPLLFIMIIAYSFPAKSFLFVAIFLSLLFLIETHWGKLHPALYVLIIVVSPIFNFFNNTIGFPIRIWLGEISAVILKNIFPHVESIGNTVVINGNEFAVDEACAGLKMLTISLIIASFLIVHYYQKTKTETSFSRIVIFFFSSVTINVIGNLMRILTLILFRIEATNPMHEFIGIICLILYILLPVSFIAKQLFDKNIPEQSQSCDPKKPFQNSLSLHIIILIAVVFISTRLSNDDLDTNKQSNIQLPGFRKTQLKSGITKFENDQALIYAKPVKFYSAEHNPRICWKGSGYDFKTISEQEINGTKVFSAILIKGNDKIYSAWWFESKRHKTINQLDWRWQSLKANESFNLINVNTTSKAQLISTTEKLLSANSSETICDSNPR